MLDPADNVFISCRALVFSTKSNCLHKSCVEVGVHATRTPKAEVPEVKLRYLTDAKQRYSKYN